MADHEQKWLVLVVAVDERKVDAADLPPGVEMSTLPDALDGVLEALGAGALDLENVYLLEGTGVQQAMLKKLDKSATPYHAYAVEKRREPCRKAGCTRHPHMANVVSILTARRQKK